MQHILLIADKDKFCNDDIQMITVCINMNRTVHKTYSKRFLYFLYLLFPYQAWTALSLDLSSFRNFFTFIQARCYNFH